VGRAGAASVNLAALTCLTSRCRERQPGDVDLPHVAGPWAPPGDVHPASPLRAAPTAPTARSLRGARAR